VLTVKPGFVATKMTEDMDLPEKLTAQPEEVAIDIYNAQQKGKNVLYTKWIWKWVMLIIRNIPEFQFKKMSI
jgi:short-subunit dehydrogenase